MVKRRCLYPILEDDKLEGGKHGLKDLRVDCVDCESGFLGEHRQRCDR